MDKNFKEYVFIDKIKYLRAKRGKQGESECLFCDFQGEIIDSTEDSFCILNKYPYNPGHLLVVPKRHVESLEELTEREYINCFKLLKKCKLFFALVMILTVEECKHPSA